MLKNDAQLDDFFNLKTGRRNGSEKESFQRAVFEKFNFNKLRFLPPLLSKKERYLLLSLVLLIFGSIIAFPFTFYYHYTTAAPADGGVFSEGLVGKPRYVNPLLSQTNDVDRDLVKLIFSGLLKYNESGKLVPDLVKSYEVSSDGLNYSVYLKEDAKWHDGAPLTASDVIFTVQTIQNADYGSPQRINWQGVETEKINEYAIMFKLKNKYAQFLNNLTVNILPGHIWQDIKPINFNLSEFNLKPVGSGPYKFKKLKKDKLGQVSSYELEANKNFYDGRPNIDSMELKFYDSEDELIEAYNKNEVSGVSSVSPQNLAKIKFKKRLNLMNLKMPRYFAVFFNQNQSSILSDKNVRLAINYGVSKENIISQVLSGNGAVVDSPMIGEVIDMPNGVKRYEYNPERALKLLAEAGWGNPDEKGILAKKEARLNLKLTTSPWPELTATANILKEQLLKIGINLDIEVLPTPALQQAIKDRNYQMLLFGEILTPDSDPFSLWHSSQKKDPGLNLALYDNKTADTILEEARQTLNPLERMKKYDDFQKIVIDDMPAVFLYNPFYVYGQSRRIKGYETKIISTPADRFSGITDWYVETERIWK